MRLAHNASELEDEPGSHLSIFLQSFFDHSLPNRSTISPSYLTVYTRLHLVNKYGQIDHRNDAITCSKLKWNHESQVSSFTSKF